jgi:sn-glycerol 3-phosphate transport system substrate-binding protein
MSRFRTGATALAALLAASSVLAACGGGDDDSADGGSDGTDSDGTPAIDLPECPVDALEGADGPVEVVVWHYQTAKPLETLEGVVADYNASQDAVEVRLESQGSTNEELQRKFEAGISGGDLPQLLVTDDTTTQVMADSGAILPAQSCLDAAGQTTDDLLEVAVDYYTLDGVLWPGSANLGNILMYFNVDHFEQAGLDPDDPPATLAELREAAEAIQAAGVTDTPLVHELASWKTEFWLTGAGSSVVDNENGRGGGETTAANLVDNPQAMELFTWFSEMEADGLMLPVSRAAGAIDHYLAMAEQNASILIESSSAATSIEAFLSGDLDPDSVEGDISDADASGLRMAAASVPTMEEGGTTQVGGNAWYMTSTGSEEQQAAAWDFLQFMNTPEVQATMLTGGSYLPYVPAANDTPEAQEFYTSGLSGQWLAIANESVQSIDPAFPGPLIGPYYDFRLAIEAAHDRLLIEGATPAEALAGAQEEIDAAIEVYNDGAFG